MGAAAIMAATSVLAQGQVNTANVGLGLITINPDTRIDVMAFAGTSSKGNMALRFRNRSTYNIIGAGTHYMGLDEEFPRITWHSIGHNFEHAFVWDNDNFNCHLFAHPYHGNLYFNSARSNGLNFWCHAHYRDFTDVDAKTFELRAGLTYKL